MHAFTDGSTSIVCHSFHASIYFNVYGAEELPAEEFSTGVASKEVVSTEVASKEVVSKEVVSKKEVLPASEEADSLLVLPVSGTSGRSGDRTRGFSCSFSLRHTVRGFAASGAEQGQT